MRFLLIIITHLLCFSLSYSQSKRVKLLFAGDAMQHQSQIDAAKTKTGFDYSSYFSLIKKDIQDADVAIVNLEVTLAGKPYTGYPCFSAPDEFAEELKDAGFDIFLTANNHCLDKGRKGLERTITRLDSMKVSYLGTYQNQARRDLKYPVIIIKNGIRIALLNYTYGTNGIEVKAPNIVNYIDKKQIVKDLTIAKLMKPDIIIANMHWGLEYKLTHNKEQKDLADFLIRNGVRLVIGSHPHVVQPIDIRRDSTSSNINEIIVYSLGNFVSGMKAVNTDGGMMVNITLEKDQNNEIKIDSYDYSLVWVHKPIINGKQQVQLIPVEKYENTQGLNLLGENDYQKMISFSTSAKKAIESLWK